MITHEQWDRAWFLTVASLVVFTPLVVLRIRQSWRHRSSIPAVAAGAGATVLYVAWLTGLQQVWQLQPAALRGVLDVALWDVVIAACLQIFMVGAGSDIPASRLRQRVRVLIAIAATVFGVVLALSLRAPRCVNADMYVCSSMPIPRDQVPTALIAAVYISAVLVHCAWLGFRRANRTAAGWGMGLLACGCTAYLICVVHAGFYRTLSPGGQLESFTGSWAVEGAPASAGTAFIIAGFVYPPVAVRVHAYRCLRRLAPLWALALSYYPTLAAASGHRVSVSERLWEQVAHLQDALTLSAQLRRAPLHGDAPPPMLADHAGAVARWFAGDTVPHLNCRWLQAPASTTVVQWMLAVADSYDTHRAREQTYAEVSSASGMPSTLRR
ncbi:Uncharacterised protein [Mycobacteroides abscessus subsp. massiliense]|uniref:hypothetical protein n=1 Tax=Mycobacteroides abscessus TaxID=36809 RepID=UPI0009A7B19B|nr:hypothetical protein [Mycobacteroides abscessus]SKZ39169.1 Uncharacterised protein [Mycobacteroides abscessus subsp. massiliense]SKZ39967.1 Uncharacterised protein [Mycobacteroides abscessus subsp. massiliense]